MVDIHIQAHANGVGGDQKIHFAGLIERHLGIAGSGAERAHDHRRAAALATDQLGNGIDGVGGEGDDRAAPGQAAELLRAVIGQFREPLAGDELRIRQEAPDQRGKRTSA